MKLGAAILFLWIAANQPKLYKKMKPIIAGREVQKISQKQL